MDRYVLARGCGCTLWPWLKCATWLYGANQEFGIVVNQRWISFVRGAFWRSDISAHWWTYNVIEFIRIGWTSIRHGKNYVSSMENQNNRSFTNFKCLMWYYVQKCARSTDVPLEFSRWGRGHSIGCHKLYCIGALLPVWSKWSVGEMIKNEDYLSNGLNRVRQDKLPNVPEKLGSINILQFTRSCFWTSICLHES